MACPEVLDGQTKRTFLFLLVSFIGLAYVLTRLPGINGAPPGFAFDDRTCIEGGWKYLLITTHILIFVIVPVIMKIFYTSQTTQRYPTSAVFATQLGFALLMVAIASEIGWHTTQCWYYDNDFTMLNFMFYFFTLSSFALWADGLLRATTPRTDALDMVFAILLLVVSVTYPIGWASGNTAFKVPIYISMTVIFGVLSWRAYQFLEDRRIILFPLLSVGVNLMFVYFLQTYGGDPYENPQVAYNALFHILHDLLGTEAGIVVFGWLVYTKMQDYVSGETAPLIDA